MLGFNAEWRRTQWSFTSGHDLDDDDDALPGAFLAAGFLLVLTARAPPPSRADVAARSKRTPMPPRMLNCMGGPLGEQCQELRRGAWMASWVKQWTNDGWVHQAFYRENWLVSDGGTDRSPGFSLTQNQIVGSKVVVGWFHWWLMVRLIVILGC